MNKLLLFLLLSASVAAQTEGTIESAGSKLYYRTFGTGQPLLIINGGPGMNSDGFVPLAQRLSAANMTIIYDQRGTGKSSLEKVNSATVTMDLMVADLENLRKHLGFEKWSVLGHSFGGMLASYYASVHPDKIDKLILSSSGGIDLGLLENGQLYINSKLSQTEKDSLAYWNQKISNGDNSYATRLGRGRSLAPAYVYHKKYVPIITERLTQGNLALNTLVWQDLTRIRFNCAPKLATYNGHVLIVQGKNDVLDLAIAEKSQKAFKNSELVLLDKCGHYGWLDREQDYFAAVDNFLKTN